MMLYCLEQLLGSASEALDGRLGKIKDVYFDAHRRAVRYLAIDTGLAGLPVGVIV